MQAAVYFAIGALVLGGCAAVSAGPEPDAVVASSALAAGAPATGVGRPRPRFFAQWNNDLPGLTRRPAVAPDTDPPEYPPAAVRDSLSGVTTLETCVTTDGRLADIHVVQSSGYAILDAATLEWARIAKFTPAEINGEPFAVCGYRFDHAWRVAE